MSYTLELNFRGQSQRVLRHFGGRGHFRAAGDSVFYEHPRTGVYFSFKLHCSRNIALLRTVTSVEFEINYCRPSFFGTEGEKELSAFVQAFRPGINDDQIHGMGEGPYSRQGFFNGWNFGNEFSVHNALSSGSEFQTLPAETLRATWEWNYDRDRRARQTGRFFIPFIRFVRIGGRFGRAATWPEAMSVSLPRVDYVFIGRIVAGAKRYGLASWSEMVDLAASAGFDTSTNPLNMEYFTAPPAIENWVAGRSLIKLDKVENIPSYRVLDEELVAAGREFGKRIVDQLPSEPGH